VLLFILQYIYIFLCATKTVEYKQEKHISYDRINNKSKIR